MHDGQRHARLLKSGIDAERGELEGRDRLFRAAQRELAQLADALAGRPSDGRAASRLTSVQERIADLHRHCVASVAARLDRLDGALSALQEDLGLMVGLAAVGELAGSVAHEIRNPLCGMLLSVEVLETKFDPGDSRRTLIHNIHREAEKMEKVVGNLLHFTRRYTPRPTMCSMEDVVRRSVESVRRHLDRRQIRLRVRPAGPDCKAHVDPELVQQVFRNIILNAVEASPEGAGLEIVLSGGAPDSVCVTFRDGGAGIERRDLDRIFDPFFTGKHNGVGLGLCVSRKIVEAHDGSITVRSRPGEGATFTVVFPADAESGARRVGA